MLRLAAGADPAACAGRLERLQHVLARHRATAAAAGTAAASPAPGTGRPADDDTQAPGVLLVLVADQTPEAVAHALRGHVLGLQEPQRGGVASSTVLVEHHPDPRSAALLDLVEGAQVLRPKQAVGVAAAWEQGWTAQAGPPGDLVLLSTATSVPASGSITRLVAALDDPDVVAALPGTSAPAALIVRRAALERLRAASGRAAGQTRPALITVERLVRRLRALGRIEVVRDAPFDGVPVRQQPTVARPGWVSAQARLGHPDAATVGPWTYFTGRGARLETYDVHERIEIGAYCSIADEVALVNPGDPRHPAVTTSGGLRPNDTRGGHRPWTAASFPIANRLPGVEHVGDPDDFVPGTASTLRIGHDVWIGFGATVLGGVTIGHGAVIGARAVVTRDVSPYAVVVGSPARVIRSRVPEHLVEEMLAIAWWDWPEDVLVSRAGWFTRPAEEFVAAFRRTRQPAG
ncbi:hypothetical protein GCM10025868_06940 [Angustibacter aerolatus]|uniref:Acetyltransferase n=1 Tax=Angustibacter aerolatus TaxID=1162965 RepID=A0ABQ6JE73_9ACTN|nr:hypothetical protein [Angustibacter aerolatus]GMA85444.1 hypothetical protein GCM10025868_06940 [Angustibacter aerolatus]